MNSCGPNSPRAGTRAELFFWLKLIILDLKIVILGGGGVGKSSFIYRYTHNDFTDTLSVKFNTFHVQY